MNDISLKDRDTLTIYKNMIIDIAKDYDLKEVYLFGSYARNEENSDSDIDIIVDTEGSKATTLFSLGALYEDLKASFDKEIDIMTLESLNEYMNDAESSIIANSIRKDMVKIYGRKRRKVLNCKGECFYEQ